MPCQSFGIAGTRQDRVSVIPVEFNSCLAVLEGVTEIIDNQRQHRSLVLSCARPGKGE